MARPKRLWRPRALLGAGAPAVPHTYPKTVNVDKGLLAAAIEEALARFPDVHRLRRRLPVRGHWTVPAFVDTAFESRPTRRE
jgi:hypothetical protein